MQEALDFFGRVIRGIIRIIEAALSGVVNIISEHPKFSVTVFGIIGFLWSLENVPGFGEKAVNITVILLILGAFGLFKKKKKK